MKKFEVKTTAAGAIDTGYQLLQELRDEVREVCDNASGTNLENTSRIQTLTEIADTLDGFCDDEPDTRCLDDVVDEFAVRYIYKNPRSPSRNDRLSEAISYLDSAKAWLDSELETMSDEDERYDNYTELRDELENHVGDAEGISFPGMYG